MKSKTKTKTKRSKRDQYPAIYLAIVLSAVMFLEGILLGVATPNAWQKGLEILDVSSGVQIVMSDVAVVAAPMAEQYKNVSQFYALAATEMMGILDISDSQPLLVIQGVGDFYEQASTEMAKMLDFSEDLSYFPQVAGAFTSR